MHQSTRPLLSISLIHGNMRLLPISCLTFYWYTSDLWNGGYGSLKDVRYGAKIIEKRPESLGGQLAKAYKANSSLPLYKDNSQ